MTMLKVENVCKEYKLGQIGGTTLREELQRLHAKIHKKEDPTKRIGSKNYNKGEKFLALNDISFEVKKGERVGIIGHNGAGKSTLLKLISRVTAPTSGSICLNGKVASLLEVGTGFHAELTGRENIYLSGAILGMTKREIDSKIEKIIDFSEVREFIDTPVKRYSSGMYVKLAFAVAAHLDSEIMIMDEVLAVGDMAFQRKCIEKMNEVSREEGRTILYVSHNMATIRQLCNRVIVLEKGKIIFDGNVEDGINAYFGNPDTCPEVVIDLRDTPRSFYDHAKEIKIDEFRFIDKTIPAYSRGEKLKFEIDYEAFSNVENLKLLFIIKNLDSTPIGLSQMYSNIGNVKAGERYTATFELDIDNLAIGKYSFQPNIFNSDDCGHYHNYDRPTKNIVFEIIEDFGKGLEWIPKSFGSVSLNEIKLVEVKRIDK